MELIRTNFYGWKTWKISNINIVWILSYLVVHSLSAAVIENPVCAFPGIPFDGELTFNTTKERIIFFDINQYNTLTYPSGTIAEYECSFDEFKLNGPTQRQCQSNGTWSGSEPRCDENVAYNKKVLCSNEKCDVFTDGHLLEAGGCPVLHGDPIHFLEIDLEESYYIQNVIIYGDEYDLIQNIDNDTVTVDGRKCLRNNEIFCQNCILYDCSEDDRSQITGQRVRFEYLSPGHFPICEMQVYSHSHGLNCGLPEYPVHGFVKIGQNSVNETIATYSCSDGFTLQGSSERICSHGKWKDRPPICIQSEHNQEEQSSIGHDGTDSLNESQKKLPLSDKENSSMSLISPKDLPSADLNEGNNTKMEGQKENKPLPDLQSDNISETAINRTETNETLTTIIKTMDNSAKITKRDIPSTTTATNPPVKTTESTGGVTNPVRTITGSEDIPAVEMTGKSSVTVTSITENITITTVSKEKNPGNMSESEANRSTTGMATPARTTFQRSDADATPDLTRNNSITAITTIASKLTGKSTDPLTTAEIKTTRMTTMKFGDTIVEEVTDNPKQDGDKMNKTANVDCLTETDRNDLCAMYTKVQTELSVSKSDFQEIILPSTNSSSTSATQWSSSRIAVTNKQRNISPGNIFTIVFTVSLVALSIGTFTYCLWKKRLICRGNVQPYYELLQL